MAKTPAKAPAEKAAPKAAAAKKPAAPKADTLGVTTCSARHPSQSQETDMLRMTLT